MLVELLLCRATRAAAAIVLAGALGACGSTATTGPDHSGNPHLTASAGHDDLRPDTICLSGWQEVDGKWVCSD